jgi:hypothetical protein
VYFEGAEHEQAREQAIEQVIEQEHEIESEQPHEQPPLQPHVDYPFHVIESGEIFRILEYGENFRILQHSEDASRTRYEILDNNGSLVYHHEPSRSSVFGNGTAEFARISEDILTLTVRWGEFFSWTIFYSASENLRSNPYEYYFLLGDRRIASFNFCCDTTSVIIQDIFDAEVYFVWFSRWAISPGWWSVTGDSEIIYLGNGEIEITELELDGTRVSFTISLPPARETHGFGRTLSDYEEFVRNDFLVFGCWSPEEDELMWRIYNADINLDEEAWNNRVRPILMYAFHDTGGGTPTLLIGEACFCCGENITVQEIYSHEDGYFWPRRLSPDERESYINAGLGVLAWENVLR